MLHQRAFDWTSANVVPCNLHRPSARPFLATLVVSLFLRLDASCVPVKFAVSILRQGLETQCFAAESTADPRRHPRSPPHRLILQGEGGRHRPDTDYMIRCTLSPTSFEAIFLPIKAAKQGVKVRKDMIPGFMLADDFRGDIRNTTRITGANEEDARMY